MAETKMQAHDGDVTAFIEAVADEKQRADAHMITAMMAQLSGEPPKMWGPSIIGFGQYHYNMTAAAKAIRSASAFPRAKGRRCFTCPAA